MEERAYSIETETIGAAAELVPDELVDHCSITGSPAEVAAGLQRLAAAGFGHVACWLFSSPSVTRAAMLERLIDDVVPRLRAAEAARAQGGN
jgi:alkanesulfonate monooxygenase SsuD/methylene tetrahydromethanopterin reductase-like flavin-dependent oxidoreductase (luciferase family)